MKVTKVYMEFITSAFYILYFIIIPFFLVLNILYFIIVKKLK
jgi:hypothetical protein